MLILINDRDLMGDYVNRWGQNLISWVTVVIMVVLTLLMVVTSFFQS
jgi:Mn2+/Fe2+ NRAMP family transporter